MEKYITSLDNLRNHFEMNNYGVELSWEELFRKLENNYEIMDAIKFMDDTGGEPTFVRLESGEIAIVDMVKESPIGRRNVCYDEKARQSRKKFPPAEDAITQSSLYGLTLLNEEEYLYLQTLKDMDLKTSSWLLTDEKIRKQGGACFGDKRYGRTFIYHNGADSYYSSRGYRVKLTL